METIDILKEAKKNLSQQLEIKRNANTKAKAELKAVEKALSQITKQINDLHDGTTENKA